jgi:hypothetical protein
MSMGGLHHGITPALGIPRQGSDGFEAELR